MMVRQALVLEQLKVIQPEQILEVAVAELDKEIGAQSQAAVELALMDQLVKLPEQQTLEGEVEVPDKEVLVH